MIGETLICILLLFLVLIGPTSLFWSIPLCIAIAACILYLLWEEDQRG